MMDAYTDVALEFIAREAVAEQRRAALLSRTDGRAVDGSGFAAGWLVELEKIPARRPKRNRDARKRRLQIARWWAQARREWKARPDVPRDMVARRAAELRAAQQACDAAGEAEDCLEPVCEHNRFWNTGVEAFDGGLSIGDCPYEGPSAEQDDWLRGWLTAQLDQSGSNQGKSIL